MRPRRLKPIRWPDEASGDELGALTNLAAVLLLGLATDTAP
jgi:hypothetical protein